MFDSELNSFIFKFHQLRKTGATAHLDIDTHAGQAWVGLRVMLGPIQQAPTSTITKTQISFIFSPTGEEKSCQTWQSSDECDKVVAEDAATESSEAIRTPTIQKIAEEASINDKVSKEDNDFAFGCEICDFRSNRRTGLQVHMGRKHARIEQLDGNTTMPIEDRFDDEMEHYLQTGYMRDPYLVGPEGQKLYRFIQIELMKCDKKVRHEEQIVMRENGFNF